MPNHALQVSRVDRVIGHALATEQRKIRQVKRVARQTRQMPWLRLIALAQQHRELPPIFEVFHSHRFSNRHPRWRIQGIESSVAVSENPVVRTNRSGEVNRLGGLAGPRVGERKAAWMKSGVGNVLIQAMLRDRSRGTGALKEAHVLGSHGAVTFHRRVTITRGVGDQRILILRPDFVQRLIVQLFQQSHRPRSDLDVRRNITAEVAWIGRINSAMKLAELLAISRQTIAGGFVVRCGQAQLAKFLFALSPSDRRQRNAKPRHHQGNEDPDDRNHHQQFDQREAG